VGGKKDSVVIKQTPPGSKAMASKPRKFLDKVRTGGRKEENWGAAKKKTRGDKREHELASVEYVPVITGKKPAKKTTNALRQKNKSKKQKSNG